MLACSTISYFICLVRVCSKASVFSNSSNYLFGKSMFLRQACSAMFDKSMF